MNNYLVLILGVVLGTLLTHIIHQTFRDKCDQWEESVKATEPRQCLTTMSPEEPEDLSSSTDPPEPPRETGAGAGRLLCLLPTYPGAHKDLQPIKDTWGRRCDVLLFFSTQEDRDIPTVALPVREGYAFLWGKTKASFGYVYERHLQDVDWVLKADDDTYVVVENLRHLLGGYDSSDAVYFGHRLKDREDEWMSGGAGYVLSREAVRRLVEEGECTKGDEGPEDLLLSRCLDALGVRAVDTLDLLGRQRFLPSKLTDYLISTVRSPEYSRHTRGGGFQCCSDLMIAVHRVDPLDMYLFEFLIYHLNPVTATNISVVTSGEGVMNWTSSSLSPRHSNMTETVGHRL